MIRSAILAIVLCFDPLFGAILAQKHRALYDRMPVQLAMGALLRYLCRPVFKLLPKSRRLPLLIISSVRVAEEEHRLRLIFLFFFGLPDRDLFGD